MDLLILTSENANDLANKIKRKCEQYVSINKYIYY